jgi:hypothetical protein
MTNILQRDTTQQSLLDGVEPIGEIYQDLNTLQPAFRFLSVFKYTSSVGVNPMVTCYSRETVEALLEAQRAEYEARIDAKRKQVLLEAAEVCRNLMINGNLTDDGTYSHASANDCLTKLRRMALEPTGVDKGEKE